MFRLTKTLEFDAAHRLTFHEGKCKNLHGHTWKVEIEIICDRYDQMILDFGVIKQLVQQNFDHKVLVYKDDLHLREYVEKSDVAGLLMDVESTAENLSGVINTIVQKALLEKYKDRIEQKLPVEFAVNVKCWESKDSMAETYAEFTNTEESKSE